MRSPAGTGISTSAFSCLPPDFQISVVLAALAVSTRGQGTVAVNLTGSSAPPFLATLAVSGAPAGWSGTEVGM